MCLAIPGKILSLTTDSGLSTGRIDFSGTVITACLEYVPEAEVGDYVLVHAGVAISVLDESEAARTLEIWQQMIAVGQKLDTPSEGPQA
jgi:hydrogenase expression/formation protein HypC